MEITSSAFQEGGAIPRKHTGEGADISPPLKIADVPDDAEALALIVDDPDAPSKTWVHWLVWNIPVDRKAIPEDVPQEEEVSVLAGARQGINDFDEIGYGGPMPPPGHGTHHYRFTVHALSDSVALEPGSDRAALEDAIEGKSLAMARLTGTYERE